MKINRRWKLLDMRSFILLFGTVNAHGNLSVRSANYISSENRVMVVCLHVQTAKSKISHDHPAKSKKESYTIFLILNCSYWHAWEACTGLYQLGMTFVLVFIFNCNAEITLTLHRSLAMLDCSFEEGVCMKSNCT